MSRAENEKTARDLLKSITVGESMSSPVKTLNINDPFSEVERIFVESGIRHLPIIDDNERLVGIITQKDLYKLVSPRKVASQAFEFSGDKILDGDAYYSKEVLDSFILNNVMTKDVCSFSIDRSLGEALHAMVEENINSVVIADEDQKVIGIVTSVDIMKEADRIFLGEK